MILRDVLASDQKRAAIATEPQIIRKSMYFPVLLLSLRRFLAINDMLNFTRSSYWPSKQSLSIFQKPSNVDIHTPW